LPKKSVPGSVTDAGNPVTVRFTLQGAELLTHGMYATAGEVLDSV